MLTQASQINHSGLLWLDSEGRGERLPDRGHGCCHPGLAHDTLAGSTDLQDQCQVGPVMLTLIRKLHPPFSAPVLSQGWWGG